VRSSTADALATLRQAFQPDSVRGKRLRFRAMVRSELEEGFAGLWMRVDGPGAGDVLAFDNMSDRPIQGSTEWTAHEIVLDVPVASSSVIFGILLSGRGQAWMDQVRIEVVDASVPSTNLSALMEAMGQHEHEPLSDAEREAVLSARRQAPRWPVNLDFERRP
jgi:hypothetical protein